MQVSLQYAAEHLAELASAARRGEEVEIAQPDEPPLVLAPRAPIQKSTPSGRPRRELLGAWEGLVTAPTEAEWRAIKREFADKMPDFSKPSDNPS